VSAVLGQRERAVQRDCAKKRGEQMF